MSNSSWIATEQSEVFSSTVPINSARTFIPANCELSLFEGHSAVTQKEDHDEEYHAQFRLKDGMARCLKGGVIMDVTNVREALIAEKAGAVAVMALEKIPFDIRKSGDIARMSDPAMIKEIKKAVTIPVMAKVRIGHTVEAQVLEHISIDFIDESEVLTPADKMYHINKTNFKTPFVCGASSFEQAVRRIHEGAAMIRTKGEAGTGNIVEAVSHARSIQHGITKVVNMTREERITFAYKLSISPIILESIAILKRLPVVNFSAGGVATPADAALMMQMGVDGVFVGSGIFKSSNPELFATAIVKAVANFNDPGVIAAVSENIGTAMGSPYISVPIKDTTCIKNNSKSIPNFTPYAMRGPS